MKCLNNSLIILILFLTGTFPLQQLSAQAAQTAQLELILVEASNDGSGIGGSLKPYSDNLKRIFNFDSFRLVDRSTLRFDATGSRTAKLNGQTVKVDFSGISSGKLEAKLDWSDGRRTMLRTGLKLKKSVPAVLGGPRTKSGDATYIILVRWAR